MDVKHDEKIPRIDISRVQRICRADISIPVGAEVVIHAIEQGARFQTTFIGLIKNEYLLVHRPEQQRKLSLTVNDRITVRYISGSLVFGFSSTVAAIITKPWPIIFIDHPECFETLNLRQDDRIPCFQPVTIFKDSQEMPGKLNDISKSGCRIVIDAPAKDSTFAGLAAESEIFCSLQLPGNKEN
ncbi:MAG: flagellar brake protein, partial [Desulfobulbaceae bacterium]|nr:flagellar brake protein [Desulfobulbaceae bacterium]